MRRVNKEFAFKKGGEVTSLQDQLQQVVGANTPTQTQQEPAAKEQSITAQLLRLLPVEAPEELDTSQRLDALGISSLDRIELAIKVEQQFGVNLTEDDFRPETTLDEVLALVEQRHGAHADNQGGA